MNANPTLEELVDVQQFFKLQAPSLVEKDWFVVKALAAIIAADKAITAELLKAGFKFDADTLRAVTGIASDPAPCVRLRNIPARHGVRGIIRGLRGSRQPTGCDSIGNQGGFDGTDAWFGETRIVAKYRAILQSTVMGRRGESCGGLSRFLERRQRRSLRALKTSLPGSIGCFGSVGRGADDGAAVVLQDGQPIADIVGIPSRSARFDSPMLPAS